MRVFMEETTAAFKEILDFEIKKIEKIDDQKFREVLPEILKLSLHTEEGFEYVALVNQTTWIEIRNLQDKKSSDPFHLGDKQEIGRDAGLFMTSFWGNKIKVDEVRQFISERILDSWIRLTKRGIKEIDNMHIYFALKCEYE